MPHIKTDTACCGFLDCCYKMIVLFYFFLYNNIKYVRVRKMLHLISVSQVQCKDRNFSRNILFFGIFFLFLPHKTILINSTKT